jgi:UTP--glucose-1-phosphate uridylyltransferase
VLLGDDIVDAETPAIKQLINQYEATGSSVLGVQEVPLAETSRYGIVDYAKQDGRLYEVKDMIEKPKVNPPSNLAIMGRYVLTPQVFEFLERQEIGTGGEIQLTDAIKKLSEHQYVYAYNFEGKRYDVGEKLGFVLTTIEFALKNKEIGLKVKQALKELMTEKVNS